MKLGTKTNITSKDITSSEQKTSFKDLLKKDLFKVAWLALYVAIMWFIACAVVTALPIAYAYVFAYVGQVVGVDFSDVSNIASSDLTFWNIISINLGIVFGIVIAKAICLLIKFLSNKILFKHVFIKKHISDN